MTTLTALFCLALAQQPTPEETLAWLKSLDTRHWAMPGESCCKNPRAALLTPPSILFRGTPGDGERAWGGVISAMLWLRFDECVRA